MVKSTLRVELTRKNKKRVEVLFIDKDYSNLKMHCLSKRISIGKYIRDLVIKDLYGGNENV